MKAARVWQIIEALTERGFARGHIAFMTGLSPKRIQRVMASGRRRSNIKRKGGA